jgi:nitrogen fixation-related uncharacterized protein
MRRMVHGVMAALGAVELSLVFPILFLGVVRDRRFEDLDDPAERTLQDD